MPIRTRWSDNRIRSRLQSPPFSLRTLHRDRLVADFEAQHFRGPPMLKPLESLLRSFVELHPEDAARSFESLSLSDRTRVFRSLPPRLATNLMERVDTHVTAPLISE